MRFTTNVVVPDDSNVLIHRLAMGLRARGFDTDDVTTGVDGGLVVQGEAPDLAQFLADLGACLPPDLVVDDAGEAA